MFSIAFARKLATGVSFGLAALFLLLTGYGPSGQSNADHHLAVGFVTVAVRDWGV